LTNGIDKGQASVKLLISLCEQFHSSKVMDLVPARYWIVQPDSEEKKQIIYSGAVLVKINGCLANNEKCLPESPDLRNAILEKEQKPFKVLLEILDNNFYFYVFVLSAILLSSLMVLFESILFRGLIDIQSQLKSIDQRIAAVLLTCVFLLFLIIVEYPIIKTLFGLGRNLENKFRILFLQKLPRINDRYFQSRPRSDMAERSHQLYTLRQLPNLIGQLLQNIFHLLATMVGILYLVTDLTIWLLLMVVVLTVVPFIFRPFVTERDLRVKTHVGALSHFYLDALQGLMPIKASCAEKTIRQEHEKLQLEWASANLALLRLNVTSQTIQVIISTIFIIAMVIVTAEQKEYQLYLLLLVYWLMRIPQYTDAMAQSIRKLSSYRNVSLRAIEPLGAIEDKDQSIDTAFGEQANTITFDNVSVKMSGHYLLNDINLCIDAGEHIAIVGRSGAGKSSLAGLLLGWLKPLKGRVLLNKRELLGSVQKKFCQNTAWVDPSIQLWNTSVLNNLNYGVKNDNLKAGILEPSLLQRAELMSLISKLSNGLQTNIGEGGSLVSGGEGQRIRLGRGMAKSEATFTILDEPFSGLEREKRQDLLSSCRKLWKKSTLLFISHDISETLQFPRVIVIDGGRIVEDSSPELLAADPKSQYSQLLQAEKSVQDDCWHNKYWRRVSVTDGKLVEDKHE
jgi:ATP-binding cassette subfamily B protein